MEAAARYTEVRLDGWCQGGLGEQTDDGGQYEKDRKEWKAQVKM